MERLGDILTDVSDSIRAKHAATSKTTTSGDEGSLTRCDGCALPPFACDKPNRNRETCQIYRGRWPLLLEAACIPRTYWQAETLLMEPPEGMEEHYQAVWAYIQALDPYVQEGNGLLLQGAVGTGKTTLACAVAMIYLAGTCHDQLTEAYRDDGEPYRPTALYFSASEVSDLIFRLERKERGLFERRLERVPLLIFDDLGYEKTYGDWPSGSSNFLTSFVQSLIEKRHKEVRATLYTTNMSHAELKRIYNRGTIQRLRERNHLLVFAGKSLREPFRLPGFDEDRDDGR